MKKTYIGLTIITLSSLLALSGCGSNTSETKSTNTSESKISATTETKITTISKDNSKTGQSSISESTTDSNSSQQSTSSSEVLSNSQSTAEEPQPNAPYAIDLEAAGSSLSFQMKGINVPATITLTQNGTTTVTFSAQNPAYSSEYIAMSDTIPTKEIQLFSYNGNAIRTVRVNTQLTLSNKISGAGAQHTGEVLYVFENANGGLSLATPNYAGNVPEDQQNVLLEAVQ